MQANLWPQIQEQSTPTFYRSCGQLWKPLPKKKKCLYQPIANVLAGFSDEEITHESNKTAADVPDQKDEKPISKLPASEKVLVQVRNESDDGVAILCHGTVLQCILTDALHSATVLCCSACSKSARQLIDSLQTNIASRLPRQQQQRMRTKNIVR